MFDNIKAVIFDLDGTLIDSMWLWKSIDIEYLGKYGHEFPLDLQKEIEGMSFTETAQYFKKRFNIPDSIENIMNEWNQMAKMYYATKVTMKKWAIEFLTYLKENGILTGIATSNSKELLDTVMNRFGLDAYFNIVRTSCEVKKGKPHPDIYLKVAEDLGVLPQDCLVFEDVAMGIMAGKNAGMKVCAIYDEFSKNNQEEIKLLADYYINGYEDVIRLLEDEYNAQIFAN